MSYALLAGADVLEDGQHPVWCPFAELVTVSKYRVRAFTSYAEAQAYAAQWGAGQAPLFDDGFLRPARLLLPPCRCSEVSA